MENSVSAMRDVVMNALSMAAGIMAILMEMDREAIGLNVNSGPFNDVSDTAAAEPGLFEFACLIDCAVAFLFGGGVVDDQVAFLGEAADDDEVAFGLGKHEGGALAFLEADGGDDGLALGEGGFD